MTSKNVFLGNETAKNMKLGQENVFVGSEAGEYSLAADSSTFIGSSAGKFCKAGVNNIFIGANAGMHSIHKDCIVFGDIKHTPYDGYLSIGNVIEGFNIYSDDHDAKIINLKGNVLIDGITSVRNLVATEPIPQVVELQNIVVENHTFVNQTFETNTTIVNANFSDVNEEISLINARLDSHRDRMDDMDDTANIFRSDFESNVDRLEQLLKNQEQNTFDNILIFRNAFESNVNRIDIELKSNVNDINNDILTFRNEFESNVNRLDNDILILRTEFESNVNRIDNDISIQRTDFETFKFETNMYFDYHDSVLDAHGNRLNVIENGNIGPIDLNRLYHTVNVVHDDRLNFLTGNIQEVTDYLDLRISANDAEINHLRQIVRYTTPFNLNDPPINASLLLDGDINGAKVVNVATNVYIGTDDYVVDVLNFDLRIKGNDTEIRQLRQISQYYVDYATDDVINSRIHIKEETQSSDYVIKSESGLLKIGKQTQAGDFTTLHIFR